MDTLADEIEARSRDETESLAAELGMEVEQMKAKIREKINRKDTFDESKPGSSLANVCKSMFPAEAFVFREDDDVKRCAACGREAARLLCTRCRAVRYCDGDCQRRAWKAHKANCPTRDQRVESILDSGSLAVDRSVVELALDLCGERPHCARFLAAVLSKPDFLTTYDDEEFCAALRLLWGAKLSPADFRRLCAVDPTVARRLDAMRAQDDADDAALLRRIAPVQASCKRIYELLTVRKRGDPEPMGCVQVLKHTAPDRVHKTNRELLDFVYLRTAPEPVAGGPAFVFKSLSAEPVRLWKAERDALLYDKFKSTRRKHAPHHNIADFLALVEELCTPPYAPNMGVPKPKHAAANRALLEDRLPALVKSTFLDLARAMGNEDFYGIPDAVLRDDPDAAIKTIKCRNSIAKGFPHQSEFDAWIAKPGAWLPKDMCLDRTVR